ncbi:MAG TPA: FAD-binding protein [Devosia sp.]|nr:FAD-binding protein [Devosia sp.]
MAERLRNWAGNLTYAAQAIRTPGSVDELQSIVRNARKVRAVGSRHSFNAIADTPGDLVSLRHLNRVLEIDSAARSVRVEGGATYRDLAPALDAAGLALSNLASLPHITIVGACATSTHGSGDANPGLASSIRALEIVTASGETITLSRGDRQFDGAPVNLGALGIVSAVTLDAVPRFDARQEMWLDFPFMALVENFDAVTSSAYSVSVFSSWRGESVDQVWLKSVGDTPLRPRDFFGARWSEHTVELVPKPGATASEPLGGNEPWYQRVPHHRIDADLASGAELQTEYFIARSDAPAALAALHAMQERFAPLLQISEIRTIAADRLWLSGFYERDSVALHFAWHPDWPAVRKILPAIEAALAPFAPRPHWGKMFTMPARDVQATFPRLADFRALAQRLDPEGKFRNGFVDEYVF